jgi:hypothetical protein
MGKRAQIPCHLSKGMFSSEYAVEINIGEGKTVSFFIDKYMVDTADDKNGFIPVNVVSRKGKEWTVLLPREDIGNATRWAKIPQKKIRFV